MTEWKIHRRNERCARCERVFEDEERHFSILLFGAEGFSREDRCLECFERDGAQPNDLVFWRTRHRFAGRRGLAIDFESIEQLFFALQGRALEGPEGERLAELCYLLALLLLRKKRLKLARIRSEPRGERLVVRRPRRTEEHEVAVFDLTPERAEGLRGELERIFEGAGSLDLIPPKAS